MNQKFPWLFDGAYGTYYQNESVPFCEMANLQDPEGIFSIHREYIQSGANAIKTNTYGANTYRMTCEFEQVEKVIRAGCQIAQRAAGDQAVVFADIGPVVDEEGNYDVLQCEKICNLFLESGIRHFLFETHMDDSVFDQIIPALRKQEKVFVIASFAIDPMGYTKKGRYYQDIITHLRPLADAYGFNCFSGPTHLLRLVSELNIGCDLVSVMPNAGYPVVVNGRSVYHDNPDYFADKVSQIYERGVKILGGCCGTTPQHIRALAQKLPFASSPVRPAHASRQSKTQKDQQNRFLPKLLNGEKVVACELHAPFELDVDEVLAKAAELKRAGADLITIADSPLARARADSFLISAKIKREIGIEVMPHITCRDRNMIAIRGAVLGGYLEQLRNVLVLTGDPVPSGETQSKKSVFNFNSFQLIHYLTSLNEQIFKQEPYWIGCGANPNVLHFDAELKRCMEKARQGAKMVLTQPVYSQEAIRHVRQIKEETPLRVLAGIMPLAGYQNALFLNNEVPGIQIPDEIVDQYRDKDRAESARISEEILVTVLDKLYPVVDGFYLICPLNRTDVVAKLTERIKKHDFNR